MTSNIMNKLRLEMNSYGKRREPFFFMVDFEMNKPFICRLDSLPGDFLVSMPGFRRSGDSPQLNRDFSFDRHPVSYNDFLEAYNIVQGNIRQGNSYLVNLTFPTRVETNLTLEDIFYLSRARYKLFVRDKFVVFSPEIFVRISGKTISSYPMKGTIDASIPDAARIILEDIKEEAEHNTIVDLIRNDLSICSDNVRVTRYRYLDTIHTAGRSLLQVSSEISGEVEEEWPSRIGDLITPMLPAGSVSGAPKKETLRIISESETGPRGYYTGVFGVFDGSSFDSAVMIRFIEQNGSDYVYRSGGGITALSDPEMEYNELITKVYVPTG